MKSPIQLNNLRNLLPTRKSIMKLSEETGILLPQIDNWLDPNKKSVPGADVMVVLAKYFGCSIDYLLDMTDKKNRR